MSLVEKNAKYELNQNITGDFKEGRTFGTVRTNGTKDWLIPIKHSEQLQELNPHKITLIRIQGGRHNNLPSFPEYHNFIRDILAP